MIWLARIVVVALLLAATPERAAASSPLAPLPATVRVNISLLGTSYAKIGSTGSLTVTKDDGAVLYQGPKYTIARPPYVAIMPAVRSTALTVEVDSPASPSYSWSRVSPSRS